MPQQLQCPRCHAPIIQDQPYCDNCKTKITWLTPQMRAAAQQTRRRAVASVIVLVLCFVFFKGCFSSPTSESANTKPVPVQEQRDAYTAWYAEVGKKLKTGDDTMKIISELLVGYSKGGYDRYGAYSVAKACYDNIDALWQYLINVKPPANLSAEHKKTLTEGIDAIQTAQYERRAGLIALMEFFNSPSPSKLEATSTHFTTANSFLVDGVAKVVGTEISLGVR